MQESVPVGEFLNYVDHRRRVMLMVGPLAAALGVVVLVIHPQDSLLNVVMVALVLFGVLMALGGSVIDRRLLREARTEITHPGRTMELTTYPYRTSGRSIIKDRVMVTLDEVASHERTPLIEFKARWSTPGIGESVRGNAVVFGGTRRGQAVVVTNKDGGVLGRVGRLRDT